MLAMMSEEKKGGLQDASIPIYKTVPMHVEMKENQLHDKYFKFKQDL
jgi:hypothetical protein